MGGNRQPDYDFIVPRPGQPVPPQQYQQPYPPNPPYPPYPSYPGPGSYPPPLGQVVPHPGVQPRRSGLPGWAIALIVTPVVLIACGIASAVAVPVFLSQKSKAEWSQTTVSLPPAVNGQARNTKSSLAASDSELSQMGLPPGSLGVYGSGADTTLVIATRSPGALAGPAQEEMREQLASSFLKSSGSALTLHEADAGPLGGYLGCTTPAATPAAPQNAPGTDDLGDDDLDGAGSATGALAGTVCVATDAGSLVMLVTATPTADPAALMREVRGEAVHRS